jgi:rhamnosyltransferase
MEHEPLVSVFVRVRDESRALREVLERLAGQRFAGGMEVVVLDNESTDGSDDVARRAGARVFTLPRSLFAYGRALNLGIELSRGRIVVLLSAHSVPRDEHWLTRFIAPLLADPAIGAAYCRQVPRGPISRLELRRFAAFPRASAVLSREEFLHASMRGDDPYELARFSNSASAVCRPAALANPFRDLPYAEDRAFAVDHLMSGGKVAYVHDAVVSYERRATWKAAYHVARRAQVSKRLIRELAAIYTGRRFDSTPDTANRLARTIVVLPWLLIRLAATLLEPSGLRRRAAVFAFRSTGSTIGLAVGALTWNRHVETLVPDAALLEEARRQCRPWSPA